MSCICQIWTFSYNFLSHVLTEMQHCICEYMFNIAFTTFCLFAGEQEKVLQREI